MIDETDTQLSDAQPSGAPTGVETYLSQLTEIPVALPPNLMTLINYPAEARFVALNYFGSKATWHDGAASATFSYYAAYEPLINHPALYLYLMDKDLGHDDSEATHSLLCDRQDNKFYVGELSVVNKLLRSQFSYPLDEKTIAPYRRLLAPMSSVSEMQSAGMFEFLFGATPEKSEAGGEMTAWLDRYITDELTAKYEERLSGTDMGALVALSYIEAMRRRAPKEESGEMVN